MSEESDSDHESSHLETSKDAVHPDYQFLLDGLDKRYRTGTVSEQRKIVRILAEEALNFVDESLPLVALHVLKQVLAYPNAHLGLEHIEDAL